MTSHLNTIRAIQRAVGAEPDGVFGPVSAGLVLRALTDVPDSTPVAIDADSTLDIRTLTTISTLDPKCQDKFKRFMLLANATAATFGCHYVMTGGSRSWDEQNDLYAQGRTNPGKRVTNARGGYSWHNFDIAGDCSVFRGLAYLDETEPGFADKVHKACSVHATACGLVWGGSWTGFKDLPHYQVDMGRSSPNAGDRAKFTKEGSVL